MRKKVMAVVFAVLAFSLIAASAAWLGPVTTADVGSDAALVASCDTDGVNVVWDDPTYDGSLGDYVVQGATVDGIADACQGAELQIALTAIDGTELDSSDTVLIDPLSNPGTDDNSVSVGGFTSEVEPLVRVVVVISG